MITIDCPRCSGEVLLHTFHSTPQCSSCSSVWLDKASLEAECKKKTKKISYLSDDLPGELDELVRITNISTYKEIVGFLTTTRDLCKKQFDEMPTGTGATSFYQKRGEVQTLETVVEFLTKRIAKLEEEGKEDG